MHFSVSEWLFGPIAGSDGDSSWEDDLWGDLQGFWSDEDAQICTSQSRIVKKQRKCPSGSRRNAGLSIAPFAEIAYEAVTHNNGRIQVCPCSHARSEHIPGTSRNSIV